MHDYIRSSATIETPTNVMNKKEIVGTKDKYDHFPGNNFNKKKLRNYHNSYLKCKY
jgi:hypothetical protein